MEVTRVLKPGGVFLLISCCVPDNRMRYLLPDEEMRQGQELGEKANPHDWTVFERRIPKAAGQGIKIDPNDPRCW